MLSETVTSFFQNPYLLAFLAAVAAVAVIAILIGWGLAGRGPDEEPPRTEPAAPVSGDAAVNAPSGATESVPTDATPPSRPESEEEPLTLLETSEPPVYRFGYTPAEDGDGIVLRLF